MKRPEGQKGKKNKGVSVGWIVAMIALIGGVTGGAVLGSVGFNMLYGDSESAAQQELEARREAMPDSAAIQKAQEERQKELDAREAAEREARKAEASKYMVSEITLLDDEPRNLSQMKELEPDDAWASSAIEQSGSDNSVDAVLDGKARTSWQEGVEGDGIGERLKFDFDDKEEIKYMSFQLGNWSSESYYENNNRPKELEIRTDKYSARIEFPDKMKKFWVQFPEKCFTREIRLIIRDVYSGEVWDDTCIAEVTIYTSKDTADE